MNIISACIFFWLVVSLVKREGEFEKKNNKEIKQP